MRCIYIRYIDKHQLDADSKYGNAALSIKHGVNEAIKGLVKTTET
jgi:hypothetical protein